MYTKFYKLASAANCDIMRCPNQLFFTNQHFRFVLPNTWQYYSTINLSTTARRIIKISNSYHSGSGPNCLVIDEHEDKLGERWMEFQGINNWDGLLDPLDDDLRKEILRYGKFIQAAYGCFDFDTSSATYATCRYPKDTMLTHCGLGKSGYKVVKNLHATCNVQMPRWIERIPNLLLPQSSWIGYVAVCNDVDEIARFGRRDIVIAYRGTATCSEWLENLRATLTYLPDDMVPDENNEPMVQSGLLKMYTSKIKGHPSLQDTILEEIASILSTYSNESISITITGHSLGAALATLTAYDITTKFNNLPMVTVLSFGGPRVGNKSFQYQLDKNGIKVLRIVNSDDPITKVPGFVIDDMASRGDATVARLPSWLEKYMEDTQWVYAEVGKELKLSSKDLISKSDIATCHDLKTYLHLVNNFVSSSTCPLSATAKKVELLKRKTYKQCLHTLTAN